MNIVKGFFRLVGIVTLIVMGAFACFGTVKVTKSVHEEQLDQLDQLMDIPIEGELDREALDDFLRNPVTNDGRARSIGRVNARG